MTTGRLLSVNVGMPRDVPPELEVLVLADHGEERARHMILGAVASLRVYAVAISLTARAARHS